MTGFESWRPLAIAFVVGFVAALALALSAGGFRWHHLLIIALAEFGALAITDMIQQGRK